MEDTTAVPAENVTQTTSAIISAMCANPADLPSIFMRSKNARARGDSAGPMDIQVICVC